MDTVLFIHGWATDGFVWQASASSLGEGKNIINLNLPAHGGRLKWDSTTLLPAVREAALRLSGLADGSVVGVGWSLGAEVLLSSMKELGHKFKALVLVGATPCFTLKDGFKWGQAASLVRRMIIDMKKDPASTVDRFYGLNFTAAELESDGAARLIERYRYPGPVECSGPVPGCFPVFDYDGITAALEALYRTDLRGELADVQVPTLVVHGAKDGVTPVGAAMSLAENIRGAQIKVFEEAGHAPFITEPARFNKVVRGFTDRL